MWIGISSNLSSSLSFCSILDIFRFLAGYSCITVLSIQTNILSSIPWKYKIYVDLLLLLFIFIRSGNVVWFCKFSMYFPFLPTTFQGYHFVVPFFVFSKCSLIIDSTLFKIGHLSMTLFMTIPMLMPIGFSIERFVALGMAKNYENVRTLLGPVLVVILVSNISEYFHRSVTRCLFLNFSIPFADT